MMGALWYTHYDRQLIEATHVVNLHLLADHLELKHDDIRYAWSDVDSSLNLGSWRHVKVRRYENNCYTFPKPRR